MAKVNEARLRVPRMSTHLFLFLQIFDAPSRAL